MKKINKILMVIFFSLLSQIIFADTPYFLDFKYILNKSTAGEKAQIYLKKKLEKGIANLNKKMLFLY